MLPERFQFMRLNFVSENRELKAQVETLKKENAELLLKIESGSTSNNNLELSALKKENEKLVKELNDFKTSLGNLEQRIEAAASAKALEILGQAGSAPIALKPTPNPATLSNDKKSNSKFQFTYR